MRAIALALFLLLSWAVPPADAAGRPDDRDGDKIADRLDAATGARDVVVHLRSEASSARVRDVLAAAPGSSLHVRLPLVDAFAARATPAQIRALAARADVRFVEPDRTVTMFDVSSAEGFGVTRARVDVPGLDGSADGDAGTYSKGDLVAAVIDTGIDAVHPDLSGKVLAFKDLVNGQEQPYDDQGHGTWVSGILAGSGASGPDGLGVAPGAALVSVKVLDRLGMGSLSGIAAGIQWVVEHKDEYGIDAINLSIGDPTYCGSGQDVASQAVDAAVAAGIVVIAAAGNGGPGLCTVADPAAAAGAIAVGAMADPGAGGFHPYFWASRGPTADGRIKPDLVGPGVKMTGADRRGDGTLEASGTSAAAPFVTGAVLLMLDAAPGLSVAQVREHLVATAEDWGAPGKDNEYGYGRVDVYAALHHAGAALATPPRVPGHMGFSGSLEAGASAVHEVEVADPGAQLVATVLGTPGVNTDVDIDGVTPTAVDRQDRHETIWLRDPPPGKYVLRVRAVTGPSTYRLDVSGHFAPTDSVPPALTIDAPPAVTRDSSPALTGDAGSAVGDFPAVVLRIRRDGQLVQALRALPSAGRWAADAAALPDGAYTVTAEQGDAAGNATRTPPAGFVVDTAPPETTITGGPPAASPAREATFSFSSPDTDAFECRLDGGAWKLCRSPLMLTGLGPGRHDLEAAAVDAAGNRDPTPATWTWSVEPRSVASPEPTATALPTATPPPIPRRSGGAKVRSIAPWHGRIRAGSVADLRAADGRSVLVTGIGRAGLTATFEPFRGSPLSIEYRARATAACRHRLAAWSRSKRRWIAVGARSGRAATVAARLPAAVDRSRPISIRATCTHEGALVRLRLDVLRAV